MPHNPTNKVANMKPGRQAGLAMVEMIIVTPILLMIMYGVAEFGRAFYQHNALTKAVRDGAGYLAKNAIRGTTGVIDLTSTLEAATKNLVVYGSRAGGATPLLPGLTADDIQLSVPDLAHVQVTASYAYQPMIGNPLPTFGLGNDIDTTFTFRASNTMRALE